MRLPVDTSQFKFLALSNAERVLDYDTKAPRADANGQALWQTRLCAMQQDGADIITVKISGSPSPFNSGDFVRVEGLVASPWENGGRFGISYRADEIEPTARFANKAS